jgi:Zn-dependent protease
MVAAPSGIRVKTNAGLSYGKEAFIYAAGPAVNIIMFIAALFLLRRGWRGDAIMLMAVLNAGLALFNLLPLRVLTRRHTELYSVPLSFPRRVLSSLYNRFDFCRLGVFFGLHLSVFKNGYALYPLFVLSGCLRESLARISKDRARINGLLRIFPAYIPKFMADCRFLSKNKQLLKKIKTYCIL